MSVLALVGFVGLSLLVPGTNGCLAADGWPAALDRVPGLAFPALLPVVWFLLCTATGVSAWLVWRRVDVGAHLKRAALRRWGRQLLVGAVWPPVLLGLHGAGPGAAAVGLFLVTAGLAASAFWRIRPAASMLLLPSLLWPCFLLGLRVIGPT